VFPLLTLAVSAACFAPLLRLRLAALGLAAAGLFGVHLELALPPLVGGLFTLLLLFLFAFDAAAAVEGFPLLANLVVLFVFLLAPVTLEEELAFRLLPGVVLHLSVGTS